MPELAYKTHFDEFKIDNLVAESHSNYDLLTPHIKATQSDQLKLFTELETGLPMFDGASFSNQVHFQNAHQTPVQRWFPYREGYSIRLVDAFIKELEIIGNVFDPFAGSGTTLLASRMNNLGSFGTDVNPISILVTTVENEQYNNIDINDFVIELDKLRPLAKSSKIFHTAFELAGKIFNHEILQSLIHLKETIKEIGNIKIRNLFFVGWLSIIEDVSNIKKEGNGIKYKHRKRTPSGYIDIDRDIWEKQNFPGDRFSLVKNKLLKHLEVILSDLRTSYGRCEKKPRIFEGNCLEFDNSFSDEIQFTFFSPPYCNCFDYFEIHKVDLWIGDFVSNQENFSLLRRKGFRSNLNSLSHKPIVYKHESLENLIALFSEEKLWSKKIPDVIRGYFDDTYTLLNKLYQRTAARGYVGVVIGNSAYSGVIIPSDVLIANIAQEIGFKVKSIFATRHLTTSSQQKQQLEFLKNYLRESIVLLEK